MCFLSLSLLFDNFPARRPIIHAIQLLLPLLPQNLGGICLQDVDGVINKALMGCHGSFKDAWSQGEIKVTAGSTAASPKA